MVMLGGIQTPIEKIKILVATINHTLMMGVNPKIANAFEKRQNGNAGDGESNSFIKLIA